MLGLAARRGRHESSLVRALLGCNSVAPQVVSKFCEYWTSHCKQPPLATCFTPEDFFAGAHLCPQNRAAFLCARTTAFPSLQFSGVRHGSVSAAGEEHRGTDLQTENSPDDYMQSRYDEESDDPEPGSQSSSTESLQLSEDILRRLRRNSEGKFDNVLAVVGDPQVLAAAHERLNVRRRNWTLANNELEISHVPKENRSLRSREIGWSWFKEAAHQIKTGTYLFKPLHRVAIPARGRGEPREWVCIKPKDQVVQEAIRGVLERIYEPLFSPDARPGANVHSALKHVKYKWKGISWFLQFDVRVADHVGVQKRLLTMMGQEIDDEALFGALRRMFQLGTVRIQSSPHEDVPEGSVLTPLLGSIYFHQLDLEIGRIQEEIRGGAQASIRPST